MRTTQRVRDISPATRQVFTLILMDGPISRVEVVRRTGLSAAAVTKAVGPLIEAGYLVETMAPGGPGLGKGRPARPLEVAADQEYFVGIKLTAGELIGVLTNLRAEVQESDRIPLADTSPDAVIDTAVILTNRLRNKNARYRKRTQGIGLSSGGHIERATGVIRESSFLGWRDIPLAGPIGLRTGLPAVLQNDVRALTVVEQWFGHGRTASSFAVVTLGEGIGAGLVVDGTLTNGAFGTAGELGHIPLQPDGPLCHCGSRGCVEAVASQPAILADIGRALHEHDMSVAEAVEMARAGCESVIDVLSRAAQCIGRALATVANLVGTELIVLSGEQLGLDELMAVEIRESFRQHLCGPAAACRLVATERPFEDWARGAAAVAIDSIFDPT